MAAASLRRSCSRIDASLISSEKRLPRRLDLFSVSMRSRSRAVSAVSRSRKLSLSEFRRARELRERMDPPADIVPFAALKLPWDPPLSTPLLRLERTELPPPTLRIERVLLLDRSSLPALAAAGLALSTRRRSNLPPPFFFALAVPSANVELEVWPLRPPLVSSTLPLR